MGLLRAARGGVIEDLAIEWGTGVDDTENMEMDSEFEVVEKPNVAPVNPTPISLFDTSAKESTPVLGPNAAMLNLPPPPVIQQAPKSDKLPIPLYPGFRCSIFAIVKQGAKLKPPSSQISITGKVFGRDVTLQIPVNPVDANANIMQEAGVNKLLHTLAAKALIQLFEDTPSTPETRAQIERLGKRYSLTSSVTSFLAIDEESQTEKEAVIQKEIKQPTNPTPTSSLFSFGRPAVSGNTPPVTAGGLFGVKPAASSGGLIGMQPTGTTSSLFGAPSNAAPGGIFGTTQSVATPNLFGSFNTIQGLALGSSQPSSAPTGGSLFGGSNPASAAPFSWGNAPSTTSTSLFGSPQGFGTSTSSTTTSPFSFAAVGSSSNAAVTSTASGPPSTTTSTGLFGSSQSVGNSISSVNTNPFGAFTTFGSASNAQRTPLFGGPASPSGTGLFGSSPSVPSATSPSKASGGFGAFGARPASGNTTGSPANVTSTSLFGSSQPVASSTAPGSTNTTVAFSFGSTSNSGNTPALGSTPSAPVISLFGTPSPAASTTTSASLFGASSTGNTAKIQSPPSAPSTGLFGQAVASSTSLSNANPFPAFGSASNAGNTSTFGTTPTVTSGSLFGSSQPTGNSSSSANTNPFGQPPVFGSASNTGTNSSTNNPLNSTNNGLFGSSTGSGNIKPSSLFSTFGSASNTGSTFTTSGSSSTTSTGLFGSSQPIGNSPIPATVNPFGAPPNTGSTTGFGSAGLFGSSSTFGSATSTGTTSPFVAPAFGSSPATQSSTGFGLFGSSAGVGSPMAFGRSPAAEPNAVAAPATPGLSVEVLARAQKFDGSFPSNPGHISMVTSGGNPPLPRSLSSMRNGKELHAVIWVTLLTVACMGKYLANEREVWEFLAEKARDYVSATLQNLCKDSNLAKALMKELVGAATAAV
jgi:hypothetical protein